MTHKDRLRTRHKFKAVVVLCVTSVLLLLLPTGGQECGS